MKTFIIGFFMLLMLLLISCGYFRAIGLYNVPPDYKDTFEEINGIKFIDHPNKTSNIVFELVITQKEFSPYDSIKMEYKISNISINDTMYTYGIHKYYYNRDLIVCDTNNKKIEIIEWSKTICPVTIVDDYGRKIKSTLALNGTKLFPGDSLTGIIAFKTGRKITPELYSRLLAIDRENIPGKYKAYYILEHEEYDNLKGPVSTEILSPTVEYSVRDYTEQELSIRNDAIKIVNGIESSYSFSSVDSLVSEFKLKHPESIYNEQIIRFAECKRISVQTK